MKLVQLVQRIWPRLAAPSLAPELFQPGALAPGDGKSRWLQAIIDAAGQGLVVCNANADLIVVNPAAAELLGIQPQRSGSGPEWPPPLLALRPILERALAEGSADTQLELQRGDQTVWLEVRADRITGESGQVEGAVLAICNLTRLHDLAAARADSWRGLVQDLQAPLNSIAGFITLLLQDAVGPLNALQRDFLRTVEQETQRLSQAIETCFEEARTDDDEEREHSAEVRLGALIAEAVDRLRPLAQQKFLTLAVLVPEELPCLSVDREQLDLVFINVLDHALTFSRERSRIEIVAREAGDRIEVSVEEQAIGLPAESTGLAFGDFRPSVHQPSPGRWGAGLGLALSKQIIEGHGGRLWTASGPDGGLRLVVSLPVTYRQAPFEALAAPR